MKKLPLFSLAFLGLILVDPKCPPSGNSGSSSGGLPIFSVVMKVPACLNDQPYELKPGENFSILLGELADVSTFEVTASLQDRDINIVDDLTGLFEPKPFQANQEVEAVPPTFQRREGFHGGIWRLTAMAEFAETPPREPKTVWSCYFYPYTVRMDHELSLKVGESKSVSLFFSKKAKAEMEFEVAPLHMEAGDNLDAVTVNGYNPRDTVKGKLRGEEDHGTVRILGNEEGSMTLEFHFPGGRVERLRVRVSGHV